MILATKGRRGSKLHYCTKASGRHLSKARFYKPEYKHATTACNMVISWKEYTIYDSEDNKPFNYHFASYGRCKVCMAKYTQKGR